LIAFDDDVTIFCTIPGPKPVVPLDVPRDLIERKGVPSCEGERFDPFDESTFSPESTETWLPGSDIIPTDDASGRRSSSPWSLAMSGERPQRNVEERGRVLKPGGDGNCGKPAPLPG